MSNNTVQSQDEAVNLGLRRAAWCTYGSLNTSHILGVSGTSTFIHPFHAHDGHMRSDDRGAQWPTLAVLTLELTSAPPGEAW